jgi:hypothetical protein
MKTRQETTRLGFALVNAAKSYALSVREDVGIPQFANYLAQVDGYINTRAFEVALPISKQGRIQDTPLQSGDRLLLLTTPPRLSSTTHASLAPTLTFSQGSAQLTNMNKHGVLVGVSDADSSAIPDIDLRAFITPANIDYVARGCMWIQYDSQIKQWFATRLGQTRVFLNEYELLNDKLPIEQTQVRLMPPLESPLGQRLLGEFSIRVENTPQKPAPILPPTGNIAIQLVVGVERPLDNISVGNTLELEQLLQNLSSYYGFALTEQTQAYCLKVISPRLAATELQLPQNAFLYVPRPPNTVRSVLKLRDTQNKSRVYELVAGLRDEQKQFGSRAQAHLADTRLDVDLYEMCVAYANTAQFYSLMGLTWGILEYRVDENAWWLNPSQRPIPLFVNQRRVGTTPTRLTNDDLISIGLTASNVVLNLAIELSSGF